MCLFPLGRKAEERCGRKALLAAGVIMRITQSAVDRKRQFALFSKGSSLKAERSCETLASELAPKLIRGAPDWFWGT